MTEVVRAKRLSWGGRPTATFYIRRVLQEAERPLSAKEIRNRIEEKFGVRYHVMTIRRALALGHYTGTFVRSIEERGGRGVTVWQMVNTERRKPSPAEEKNWRGVVRETLGYRFLARLAAALWLGKEGKISTKRLLKLGFSREELERATELGVLHRDGEEIDVERTVESIGTILYGTKWEAGGDEHAE